MQEYKEVSPLNSRHFAVDLQKVLRASSFQAKHMEQAVNIA